ncbi:SRPBCC domain-containing protein [Compostibacter hankyongensis]|uniref:Activator of Hsp90 ATPase homologue 1/2-like C-terminal domain-containing protein n=1 Tax=Compostibacter hankyongensis TaxID=1007089 RepID=A0ABP8FBD0_9BACT
MKNEDFTTTLLVEATPQQVFDAVNNVRGWWSENIEGDTARLNGEFVYHYQDVHRCKAKITESIPGKKVVWHVLDNYFKFTRDKSEWKDTDVVFEIAGKGGKTQLTFTHRGLVPAYECYNICHDAWTHYVQDSLKSLILTGKGKATPKDDGAGSAAAGSPEDQAVSEPAAPKSICHRLLIEAPVEKVYGALTTQEGLAGWWTPDTTAKPEVGSVARFAFGPDYFKEMKITELKPYSSVKWVCLKAYPEWIGTTLNFELEPHAKGAILSFHHDGWKEYTSEFASCSYAWALFFRSLKLLCETGKGLPYPDFEQ